jgi:hypothetical protein
MATNSIDSGARCGVYAMRQADQLPGWVQGAIAF